MIPSLVVTEVRQALVEYLATTFALCDDETRDALSEFLTEAGDGIFRGPYLSVRTPFQHLADGSKPPLEWQPLCPPSRVVSTAEQRRGASTRTDAGDHRYRVG